MNLTPIELIKLTNYCFECLHRMGKCCEFSVNRFVAIEQILIWYCDILGKNFVQEFITQKCRESVRTVLDKAMAGTETANFELTLITKHGIRMEVLLNATSRRDEQGNIIGVVGIGQDITGSSFQLLSNK